MSASFENSCAPETRSLITSRLSTENRHRRLHLTPVVRPKNIFVRWHFTRRLDLHIERGGLNESNLWLDALNESKSTLGYTDGDWFYQCIFTLPTPPVKQNCHSDNFFFRLPSAKVHQDYQLLRTFDWCLMEKLTRNNGPFLDTCGQLIQSIKAMPMGAWLYF